METQYIGPNKVFGIQKLEFTTPAGAEVVKVMYEGENCPSEIMPLSTFNLLVTQEPKDYNYVRDTRYQKLLADLALVLMETDIKYGDIKYVLQELGNKMDSAFARASNFLWTGDDKQYIAGVHYLSDRSLLEAEQILKSIGQNEPGEDTTTE